MRIVAPNRVGSPRWMIAAFGSAFVVLVMAVFVADVGGRYRMTIDGAKESAQNYAEVLAEHTARAYEAIDRSLREAEFIRLDVLSRYGSVDAPGGQLAANRALRRLQAGSRLLVSIGWTNSDGDLVAHSNNDDPPRANIAEAPHFVAQRDHGSEAFYIAPPYRSPLYDRWLAPVSRRLSNPDGSFAGIVGAVIDQSYFAEIYRSIKLGPNGAVMVLTLDGRVLMREPPAEKIFAMNMSNGELFTRLVREAQSGSFERVSIVDGVNRLFGYRTVPGLPLLVLVSYDRDDLLAPWYRHLYIFGPPTALLTIMFGFGTGILMRQTRNLAKKTELLELTLNHMTHGLCMFDAEQRLTICNRGYAEMYDLGPDLSRPGTSFRAILENGVFLDGDRDTVRAEVERRIAEVAENRSLQTLNQLGDGRIISVAHQPTAGGGWVAIHEDITDRRRNEERVAYMAHHDLLTGVGNRAYFMEKLEEATGRLRRHQEPFAILLLDLDRFKHINDSFGHPAGDSLLKETTRRLKSTLREVDTLARLGGDEFAIIQTGGFPQQEAAVALANRIIGVLVEPYDINTSVVEVSTSIGIAMAPADGSDPDPLMKKADVALYRTKSKGRNGYCFFDEHMTADAEARNHMEVELRNALARNELEMYYQPIIDVRTRALFGVEALVRWNHPTRGVLGPAHFMPLAEETGIISAIGEWVLQKACSDAVKWPPHVRVAVNISPLQFRKNNLLDVILCVLVDSGLSPERLELEITETVLLEHKAQHLAVMRQLKNLGVSISLDDFGTGYSSLSHLTQFPFDKIKIEKSFIQNLTQRADCAAIISSVLALASGLELETVAEGVETEQQFEILRASGVDYVQGYLFGEDCRAGEIDPDRHWTFQRLDNVA